MHRDYFPPCPVACPIDPHENEYIVAFIKEQRRINPGLSLQEARADFAKFRKILKKRRNVGHGSTHLGGLRPSVLSDAKNFSLAW